MDRIYILEEGQKLTAEQIAEVERASELPIEYDEDCEKLSPDMIRAFQCAVAQRDRLLRMSQQPNSNLTSTD